MAALGQAFGPALVCVDQSLLRLYLRFVQLKPLLKFVNRLFVVAFFLQSQTPASIERSASFSSKIGHPGQGFFKLAGLRVLFGEAHKNVGSPRLQVRRNRLELVQFGQGRVQVAAHQVGQPGCRNGRQLGLGFAGLPVFPGLTMAPGRFELLFVQGRLYLGGIAQTGFATMAIADFAQSS